MVSRKAYRQKKRPGRHRHAKKILLIAVEGKNKTERNNTNPILSDESEKMKNRELLEEYFSCSLEIDLLLRLYPDDEDTIYQIVNLLVDTCDSKRKLIRIAGEDRKSVV